jgi:Rad3-related DNA helicase
MSIEDSLLSAAPFVLVEAPAGCGKTHVACDYARTIAPGLPEGRRVLVLAHTNAAVEEFISRTRDFKRQISVSTFDSLSLGFARSAYDDDDQIDGFGDERRLRRYVSFLHELLEPDQARVCVVGMDGRDAAGVTRVPGLEHRERLGPEIARVRGARASGYELDPIDPATAEAPQLCRQFIAI